MGSEINYSDIRPIDFEFKSIRIIPIRWNGDNAERAVDMSADAYGVYLVKKSDNKDYWIKDFDTSIQALRFVKFLLSVAQNYKPDEKL